MTDYQNEALEHELQTTMTMLQSAWEEIEIAHDDFFDEPSINNGFKMVRAVRSWINYRQSYELLHKIFHHGWGQEDTKHE